MEDSGIITLFWKRDERAISEFENKYKKLCHTVALGITGSRESAEECVSDTSLRLWNGTASRRKNRSRLRLTP